MNVSEIMDHALADGVLISLNGAENIKVTGDEIMVNKWLPAITENKNALLSTLAEKKQNSPKPCQNCNRLDVLLIGGKPIAGCVRQLDEGPWQEEWHRLPADLQKCIFH